MTHSEDGREVPEVVKLQHMAVAEEGRLRWMTGRKIGECELYAMPDFGPSREPLMTVAQHERIVAAEIARLRQERDRYCALWNRAGRQTAAQPARQVGGDAPPCPIAYMTSDKRMLIFADKFDAMGWKDLEGMLPLYSLDVLNRAALAPAAVVLPCRADERQSERYMNGWNSALDEVARLNRRAIPEGLVERVLKVMEDDWYQIDGEWGPYPGGLDKAISDGAAEEIRELRALLGNEGE